MYISRVNKPESHSRCKREHTLLVYCICTTGFNSNEYILTYTSSTHRAWRSGRRILRSAGALQSASSTSRARARLLCACACAALDVLANETSSCSCACACACSCPWRGVLPPDAGASASPAEPLWPEAREELAPAPAPSARMASAGATSFMRSCQRAELGIEASSAQRPN